MRTILAILAASLVLTDCSICVRTSINALGKREAEVNFTVAPLISVTREDVLPNGEVHKGRFFGVTPAPVSERVTETTQGAKTVTETQRLDAAIPETTAK